MDWNQRLRQRYLVCHSQYVQDLFSGKWDVLWNSVLFVSNRFLANYINISWGSLIRLKTKRIDFFFTRDRLLLHGFFPIIFKVRFISNSVPWNKTCTTSLVTDILIPAGIPAENIDGKAWTKYASVWVN